MLTICFVVSGLHLSDLLICCIYSGAVRFFDEYEQETFIAYVNSIDLSCL